MSEPQIDLSEVRKNFQDLGFLQKFEGKSWNKEWITKKYVRLLQIRWSQSGLWESLQSSGVLKINYFTFQKMLWLSDGIMYVGHELMIGPLHIQYGKA